MYLHEPCARTRALELLMLRLKRGLATKDNRNSQRRQITQLDITFPTRRAIYANLSKQIDISLQTGVFPDSNL